MLNGLMSTAVRLVAPTAGREHAPCVAAITSDSQADSCSGNHGLYLSPSPGYTHPRNPAFH